MGFNFVFVFNAQNNIAQRQLRSSKSQENDNSMDSMQHKLAGSITKPKKTKRLSNSSTCPSFYHIPASTRKRITRFLYDNSWIDFV
jgi:hypothetical protein